MAANKPDYDRLCTAMQRSRFTQKKFRDTRFNIFKQWLGKHWSSESGTQNIVPVNLLKTYTDIVGRNLFAKEPRCMLSTFNGSAKPIVSVEEKWVNEQMPKIDLATTIERAVLDSQAYIGVIKVALSTPEDAASFGWNLKAGQPYADVVSLDDFVFDVHARDFKQVSFIGHRYRCPLHVARSMGYKGGKNLQASTDQAYNQEGDERFSAMTRMPYAVGDDEFEEMVDLWEVYMPRHRLVVTLPDNFVDGSWATSDGQRKPLREQKWVGPDCGPYHILMLGTVPDNAMGKGPLTDLYDLHMAVNNIFRKLLRQAERMKSLTLVQDGSGDGEKYRTTNDGDILPVMDPKATVEIVQGGPNPLLQQFGEAMRNLFSWLAGNLDAMGGLSPQTTTFHGDELLAQNASGNISDKQGRVVRFVSGIVEALCWFYHHHPTLDMKVQHEVVGLPQYNFTRTASPQQRQQIAWEDLGIKIDPYSLQHQTPQQRGQALQAMVTAVVMPMMGLAQQQGVALDMHALLTKLGRYMDMPDLTEILTIQAPPAQGDEGQSAMPAPQPETKRTYERTNRSERTGPGQSTSMQQALLGVNAGGTQKNGQMNGAMR